MDSKTRQALTGILDHFESDELEDFRESDPERQENHIYRCFEIVRDWLRTA